MDERISNLLNLCLNLGRRIIEAYFLMFLHSCPNVDSRTDYAKIISNALNTYTLGEHVGREWGIGKVLRWKLMVDSQMVTKAVDNGYIGLHKVLGTTVEAIVGGVYHQFVRLPLSSIPPLLHHQTEHSLSDFPREPQKLINSSTPISSPTSS